MQYIIIYFVDIKTWCVRWRRKLQSHLEHYLVGIQPKVFVQSRTIALSIVNLCLYQQVLSNSFSVWMTLLSTNFILSSYHIEFNWRIQFTFSSRNVWIISSLTIAFGLPIYWRGCHFIRNYLPTVNWNIIYTWGMLTISTP